jgi:hypothetical protein
MTILAFPEIADPVTGLVFMTRDDLVAQSNARIVDQMATDGASPSATKLNTVMAKAEQKAIGILLRAYSLAEVKTIFAQDQFARSSCADMALEYLSRTKPEFTSEDGKGRYYTAFKEAVEYFNTLSHGRVKTSASPTNNRQEGGMVGPSNPLDRSPGYERRQFIFSDPITGVRRSGF